MDQAAKDERNRYMREWRARNKEKVKKIQTRYWENKIKDIREDD